MYTDPRKDLSPQQRIKLLEEEGRRQDESRGERTISVISIIVFIAFVVVLPAMANYLFSKPGP